MTILLILKKLGVVITKCADNRQYKFTAMWMNEERRMFKKRDAIRGDDGRKRGRPRVGLKDCVKGEVAGWGGA